MSGRHPCFSPGAHERFARIHLPVAPACNVSCGFCDRRFSCVNESRPGVTAEVLDPDNALLYLEEAAGRLPNLSVVGIAGPGDPLANPNETLRTLELARQRFPHLMTCVSTNGLALPELAAELRRLGVSHVTVTVNAANPRTARRIYNSIGLAERAKDGCSYEDAMRLLLAQEHGIRRLARLGVAVKVNTVVLPGINEAEVADIARRAAEWGAQLMNCIALIPVAGTRLGNLPGPEAACLGRVREAAEAHLPQMRHCARCRADAAGLLGERTKLSDFAPRPNVGQYAQLRVGCGKV